MPASGRPAISREGNVARLRTGHHSPRVVGAVAERLTDDLLERRPDLAAYPEALRRFASWEARCLLLRAHLDEVGDIDPDTGNPREPLLRQLSSAENHASKAAAALGLDPRAHAALERERAAAGLTAVALTSQLHQLADTGRAALDSSAVTAAALAEVVAAAPTPAPDHSDDHKDPS